jgi:hypothetical protein
MHLTTGLGALEKVLREHGYIRRDTNAHTTKPPSPTQPLSARTTTVNPMTTPNPDTRIAPPGDPFKGPPEPQRTIPEAMIEARLRAYGAWREYLPDGMPRAEYEPFRTGEQTSWLRLLAIASATTPLELVLPSDEVKAAAERAAEEAFDHVADLLSNFEPDFWVDHGFWAAG